MKNIKFYLICIVVIVFYSQSMFSQNDYNKLDSNGKKHGLWKGFYDESKRPRYEGNFSHGKETGIFNFYDDTKAKSIIATRDFSSNDGSAYTIFYDQAKNKVSEGKVVNKLFEGPWKYYHLASKNIMTTENYKLGKLQGVRTVYYSNGKIAEQMTYKNNLKEGVYKKFTENGVVLEESNFKNNEYNGLATFFDTDGNVVSKGQFVNGKKAGIWQFFEKGKTAKSVNMSNPENATKAKNN